MRDYNCRKRKSLERPALLLPLVADRGNAWAKLPRMFFDFGDFNGVIPPNYSDILQFITDEIYMP